MHVYMSGSEHSERCRKLALLMPNRNAMVTMFGDLRNPRLFQLSATRHSTGRETQARAAGYVYHN